MYVNEDNIIRSGGTSIQSDRLIEDIDICVRLLYELRDWRMDNEEPNSAKVKRTRLIMHDLLKKY